MPNDDLMTKIAAAKAALQHAQATFPAGNSGHAVGQAFAQQHQADSAGTVRPPSLLDPGPDAGAAIKARQDNIKAYMDATQGK